MQTEITLEMVERLWSLNDDGLVMVLLEKEDKSIPLHAWKGVDAKTLQDFLDGDGNELDIMFWPQGGDRKSDLYFFQASVETQKSNPTLFGVSAGAQVKHITPIGQYNREVK